MSTPGGSNLQVQYNDNGAFGGMAGTSWNQTQQSLRLDAAADLLGAATLTLSKSGTSSSVLDLEQTYSGKVLRVLGPPDIASRNPVTYIGNGGEIKTRAWLTVSGNTSGSGDTYVINEPIDSGFFPQMMSVWADVPFTLNLRSYNADGSKNIVTYDRQGRFVFGLDETGALQWTGQVAAPIGAFADSAAALAWAQTVWDVSLSRIGAGKLALGAGQVGDFGGTLKLTQLEFSDGTVQTTAATSSGVSGLVIGSGKSLTVNAILTLAGVDAKTLTINNSIGLSGTDATTMTFPAVSATVAGLGVAQTWTAQQTFNVNPRLANGRGLEGALNSGAAVPIMVLDTSNNLTFGAASLTGQIQFVPGTGRQVRFLNAATTLYIAAMQESTLSTAFGSNTFDGLVTLYDARTGTGDTTLSIRSGAARPARVRFGTAAGAYDTGLSRDAAGVLAVNDASTNTSQYRDLLVRNLFAGGASAATGGGAGVIAIANATTVPNANPAAGGVLFVENGALKYRGSSGTVTTLAPA